MIYTDKYVNREEQIDKKLDRHRYKQMMNRYKWIAEQECMNSAVIMMVKRVRTDQKKTIHRT